MKRTTHYDPELQVVDYLTLPLTELLGHPGYQTDVHAEILRLAVMSPHDFRSDMAQRFLHLDYSQREQVRRLLRELESAD